MRFQRWFKKYWASSALREKIQGLPPGVKLRLLTRSGKFIEREDITFKERFIHSFMIESWSQIDSVLYDSSYSEEDFIDKIDQIMNTSPWNHMTERDVSFKKEEIYYLISKNLGLSQRQSEYRFLDQLSVTTNFLSVRQLKQLILMMESSQGTCDDNPLIGVTFSLDLCGPNDLQRIEDQLLELNAQKAWIQNSDSK